MAGFVDVLLRGIALLAGGLALGGPMFAWIVLGAGPGTKPDRAAARALRLAAAGASIAAAAQLGIVVASAMAVARNLDGSSLHGFFGTNFARVALLRAGLGAGVAILALRLARRPGGGLPWALFGGGAVALVASFAGLSHAVARTDWRPLLVALDAVHQVAAALWVGGLAHLLTYVIGRSREPDRLGGQYRGEGEVARRFSRVALASVSVLAVTGFGLALFYVGDGGALVGTAYGIMVLTKAVLFAVILGLGFVSSRLIRQATERAGEARLGRLVEVEGGRAGGARLGRLVEVEVGLAVTVLFVAASLTSLPPAADLAADRATLAEVVSRFTALPPRLTSPAVGDLLSQVDAAAGGPGSRFAIEREWSEYNHHWAGLFVLGMGALALIHGVGWKPARRWPLLMVGLAAFVLLRSDPEVWPLGRIGFWESLAQPEILQHRAFAVLILAFGVFEWAVRAGRLRERPWGYVFPLACAAGGGLLLTHSHAVFDLKEAFLMEVTHAPIGIFGVIAGWARWLEIRLPESAPATGRVWPGCLIVAGLVLLCYSEG